MYHCGYCDLPYTGDRPCFCHPQPVQTVQHHEALADLPHKVMAGVSMLATGVVSHLLGA